MRKIAAGVTLNDMHAASEHFPPSRHKETAVHDVCWGISCRDSGAQPGFLDIGSQILPPACVEC